MTAIPAPAPLLRRGVAAGAIALLLGAVVTITIVADGSDTTSDQTDPAPRVVPAPAGGVGTDPLATRFAPQASPTGGVGTDPLATRFAGGK